MHSEHHRLGHIASLALVAVYFMLELGVFDRAASQVLDRGKPKWATGYIPMKDEVKLAYVLHTPGNKDRFPVLVTYNGELGGATPRGLEEGEYLANGYGILGTES
jgi:hypothetical protein